jgi:hypothetical protein
LSDENGTLFSGPTISRNEIGVEAISASYSICMVHEDKVSLSGLTMMTPYAFDSVKSLSL